MAQPRSEDRQVLIESGERPLTGMLHLPAGGQAGTPAIFCNAFGDERKSSCLAMVRLARRLAAEGTPVVRFDYWGCGDSPGDFVDATVSTRLGDISSAVRFALAQTGERVFRLLGLRLGAALAALAAEGLEGCAGLALVAPVADAAAYLRGLSRRKLLRRMISAGRGPGADEGREIVDLDGYAIRRSVLQELGGVGIKAGQVSFGGPVLVVQVSFNERLKAETAAVRDAYASAGAKVDVRRLVLPPFWSRVDISDTTPLDDALADWLKSHT